MPKGPNGEWRPRDPIECSAHVMKVLTGEIEETYDPPRRCAARLTPPLAAGPGAAPAPRR